MDNGDEAGFAILALGKLGGSELNYSSDINLMFLYEHDGQTDGSKSLTNVEFFRRLAKRFVQLMTATSHLGSAYRVDLRLRPEGGQGALVTSVASALRYYDLMGRTWERQAFIKARPVAGDLSIGAEFLQNLQPWIYRKYLTQTDITGIKALKRRIEKRAKIVGDDYRDVKVGHGGIRDIEFTIQFLQLLNGGELPGVRTGNTLEAIRNLEAAGCLTMHERAILEHNYVFLRKIEHRLQVMFDAQTHRLPDESAELRKLAIRMNYVAEGEEDVLSKFQADLEQRTSLNRRILDHLLHDAFSRDEQTAPEVDLILDPDPDEDSIRDVLGKYGFDKPSESYRHLSDLAKEGTRFLSTRRCRHFLASISPRLLREISLTPDPNATLVNLSRVSDSLGGKGVLWELFSFSPPSMRLYVRLCAACPYLAGILTSNPGMIDELMDSLVVEGLPSRSAMAENLDELVHGAEDLTPILHGFKNTYHLRVGVRDILGRDDILATNAALADVAQVCLKHVVRLHYERLVQRFGVPTADDGDPCDLVVVGMGKLGGREPNYHSDLDVIFLYEAEGKTVPEGLRQGESTTNQHFFSLLGQDIIKTITTVGTYGQLYPVDPRLRPTGASGALAVSFAEFRRYFREGQGQLWERQALCKARPVVGSERAMQGAREVIRDIMNDFDWQPEAATAIRDMRFQMEHGADKRNLKRGSGGTVDVEFIVQMLQLKHLKTHPRIMETGTLYAIEALRKAGLLDADDAIRLDDNYGFLRSVEARLRLMNTTARHDLPAGAELAKLAYLLHRDDPEGLKSQCDACMASNRQLFERLMR